MSVTDHAFLALDTLQKIGGHFGTELREDDPERAARRRELETEISSALPLLDVVSADLRVVLARGATLDVTQLHVLRTICRKFSAIYDHTLGRLHDCERTGSRINQAAELKTRLREIHDVLGSIGRSLEATEFRLPVPPSEQPQSQIPAAPAATLPQSAPFDLPRPGTWVSVAARPGPVRLPDPPFLTEEQSAPFDLPLIGPRVRIKGRLGPVRLPDPLDD